MSEASLLTSADTRARPASARQAVAFALGLAAIALILAAPARFDQLSLPYFLRWPVELPAVCLVLILAQGRPAALLRALIAAMLVLLLFTKIADAGSYMAFARPFNPILDFYMVDAGWRLLSGAIGKAGASAAVAAVVLAVAATAIVAWWATGTIGRFGRRHRAAFGAVAVAALVGSAMALSADLRGENGLPVASFASSRSLIDHGARAVASIGDIRAFAKKADGDPLAAIPNDRMLASLRGKDVVMLFVESYGESALRDPRYAPSVVPVLDGFDAALARKGFAVRSAFLTSTTVGGSSWLAHGTMLSGLRIDNQRRYEALVASDRATLNRDFRRAGWSTAAVMPAITLAWPEGDFFGYDRIYAAADLGYRGKPFNWVTMPDQFTMAAIERLELAPRPRPPVMVEAALISSHAPWTPIPEMVEWDRVGDGTIFDEMAESGDAPEAVWKDSDRVRLQYRLSIEYALNNLASFVERYGTEDLVLVILGDHQPAPLITGGDTSRDVPVSIVAGDPSLLAALDGWHWTPSMLPAADAPVWPMQVFRERFVTAFTPEAQ